MSTPTTNTLTILTHKRVVSMYIRAIILDLIERSTEHDYSKFSTLEFEAFEVATPKLATFEYGSDDYKAALREIGPALAHHYRVNRHHPDHFADGINDMTLVDLVEMLCDWMAACEQGKNGDIYKSLDLNQQRYHIGDQLSAILKNTVDILQ